MNKSIKTTKILLLFLFIINSFSAYAQEYFEVKGVKGEAEILVNSKKPIEHFVREAIDNAKVKALLIAGILERVDSPIWYENQDDEKLAEFSSPLLFAELRGAILKYEIIGQDRKFDPATSQPIVEVNINATVIRYQTERDPEFTVYNEGIKSIYKSKEELYFSVKSSKSCYLNLFMASRHSATILYPNTTEEQLAIEPDKVKEFSIGELPYSLVNTIDNEQEYLLLFVFTKEPLSFFPDEEGTMEKLTTVENIMLQILSIEPNERVVKYQFIGFKH